MSKLDRFCAFQNAITELAAVARGPSIRYSWRSSLRVSAKAREQRIAAIPLNIDFPSGFRSDSIY